jgi:hypothetical protein
MFGSILSNRKGCINEKYEETLKIYIEPQTVDKYLNDKDFCELYTLANKRIPNSIESKDDILNKIMNLRVRKELDMFYKMGGGNTDISIICTLFALLGIVAIFL